MSIEELKQYLAQYDNEYIWVVKIFLVVFVTLLIDMLQKRVLKKINRRLEKTNNLWDDAFIHALIKPLSFFIWVFGLSIALQYIKFDYVEDIRSVGTIVAIAWILLRLINYVGVNILHKQEIAGKSVDKTTADAISQLLRVSVLITAGLVGLESMGFNISAILAFGGIGGIAIGFAAKDLLSNFFGGMMIYLDRPFAVGDWVRSSDKNIEGTVEKIGWRLTIIRTFDKRPLYVPNSVFATIAVENPSRMSHRRIYETFGVRYADAAKLPAIVEAVKEMLLTHEEIDTSQTMIVNFDSFAPSSLDFFVYTFTKTTNWIKFHEVKQDVLFKINAIVESHGAEFAFPTSTMHIPNPIKLAEQPQPHG